MIAHMDAAKIIEIAIKVRQDAEKRAKGMFGADLCGMCAIASAMLFEELVAHNIPAAIVANDMHCWVHVRLDKWYAVDLTATQFGYREKVLFVEASKILQAAERDLRRDRYAGAWERQHTFKTVRGLRLWQKRAGWPEMQIV